MKRPHSSNLVTLFGEEETKVAEILLELPRLFLESKYGAGFFTGWGRKRRRSAMLSGLSLPRSRLPPYRAAAYETQSPNAVKAETSSPATPLSFSPSESDDKPRRSKRRLSKLRKREEWSQIVEQLTKQQEELEREIEKVRLCRDKLRALNLELKARGVRMRLGVKDEKPPLEGLPTSAAQSLGKEEDEEAHRRAFRMDGAAVSGSGGETFQCAGSASPQLFSHRIHDIVGPLSIPIPDLNISLEESLGSGLGLESGPGPHPQPEFLQPLDPEVAKRLSKALAFQARQKRREIQKFKNSSRFHVR